MKEEPATGSCWFWCFSGTNKFVIIKRSTFDHSIPNSLSGRKNGVLDMKMLQNTEDTSPFPVGKICRNEKQGHGNEFSQI